MARKAAETDAIHRAVSAQERAYLEAMASDAAGDKASKIAKLILAVLDGGTRLSAATAQGVSRPTARSYVQRFEAGGWKALITVLPPRGGDFLARYDQWVLGGADRHRLSGPEHDISGHPLRHVEEQTVY